MATLETLSGSVEDSRPIELYEFSLGNDSYRFTSAEDDLTPVADKFTATSIARNAIVQGSDQNNRNLIVTMPATEALAQLYVDVPPPAKLNLSIFRYERDESPAFTTQILQFKGVVQSVRFPGNGTVAEFTVRSAETALNRNVPRVTFMGMCNHILGDSRCGATASTYTGAITAISADGRTLTVNGLSGGFAGALTSDAGYCYISGAATADFRLVLSESTDDVELLVPFQSVAVGQSLVVVTGCDHLVSSGCVAYDRIANFGGFAWVPSKNIFDSGVL